MARNETTSAIIDSLLKFLLIGGLLSTAVFTPNAVQALDKPLQRYYKKLDYRQKNREYRRYLAYMRRQGLISFTAEDYEHGIQITKKGRRRAKRYNFDVLALANGKKWDGRWRIILFDIPENKKYSRDRLSRTLKRLGMVRLQKSVWVYPFECREEIESLTDYLKVNKYTSYLEAGYIEGQAKLKKRFRFDF